MKQTVRDHLLTQLEILTAKAIEVQAEYYLRDKNLCWDVIRNYYAYPLRRERLSLQKVCEQYQVKVSEAEGIIDNYILALEALQDQQWTGGYETPWSRCYRNFKAALTGDEDEVPMVLTNQRLREILARQGIASWPPEKSYLVTILMALLGYRGLHLPGAQYYRDECVWYRRDLLSVQRIEDVVAMLRSYGKGDWYWTVEEIQSRCEQELGVLWTAEQVQSLFSILRVEPVGLGRWRWEFKTLRFQDRILRIFREENRILRLQEVHRLYQQRTGENVAISQITYVLSSKDCFKAFRSQGEWGLAEWNVTERRTKIEIVYDVLARAPQPISLRQLMELLRQEGHKRVEQWRLSAILRNREDLFVGLKRRDLKGRQLWALRERFEQGQYPDYVEVHRLRLKQVAKEFNQALHELIPPGGELVILFSELKAHLVRRLAGLGVGEKLIARHLRNLSPEVAQYRRVKAKNSQGQQRVQLEVVISYRADKQYWVDEQDTVRAWMHQAVFRYLPDGGQWITKKALYEQMVQERPDLTRSAFYLYLNEIPGIEHRHQGRAYLCRRSPD